MTEKRRSLRNIVASSLMVERAETWEDMRNALTMAGDLLIDLERCGALAVPRSARVELPE